jgi:hypothetical protein
LKTWLIKIFPDPLLSASAAAFPTNCHRTNAECFPQKRIGAELCEFFSFSNNGEVLKSAAKKQKLLGESCGSRCSRERGKCVRGCYTLVWEIIHTLCGVYAWCAQNEPFVRTKPLAYYRTPPELMT